MHIGIITFHRAYNCGAMLQAWALKTVLERMGHTVEFPVLNHVGETGRWPTTWFAWRSNPFKFIRAIGYRFLCNLGSIPSEGILQRRFKQFRKRNLPECECRVDDLADKYDAVIVGSDQVWSDVHSCEYAPVFLGESLPKELKKVAYAVSYGDKLIDGERLERVKRATRNFSAISAREGIVAEQCQGSTDKNIVVTLDPTLLLKSKDYECFVKELSKEPYLFMYTLDTSEFFVQTAKKLASRLGVKAIIAPMYQRSRLGAPSGLTYGISPDRLVGYVANAKYVVAHSFHGTVLPVLFNKPFLSLRNARENEEHLSRVGTLLKLTGNMNRLVTPEDSIEDMLEKLTAPVSIDFTSLDAARAASLEWLRASSRV